MKKEITIEEALSVLSNIQQPAVSTISVETLEALIAKRQEEEKPVDSKGACEYLAIKLSTLNSYCHKKQIPYFVPAGRKRYFLPSDLKKFLLSKRSSSVEELDTTASNFIVSGVL